MSKKSTKSAKPSLLETLTQSISDSLPPGAFSQNIIFDHQNPGTDDYQRAYPAATQLPSAPQPAANNAIMQELVKTFGGGPSSADIGRNEQAAIEGGKRVLAGYPLVQPNNPQPAASPDGPMSIQPPAEQLMSVGQGVPSTPQTVREGVPASLVPPPPSQTAPMAAGGGRAPGTASVAAPLAQTTPAADMPAMPARDAIAELLKGKQSLAEGERDSAKAQAAKAKDLTDEEKIFLSLISVLPALLGGTIGGAVAGPTGASAGAAGGLGGAAQGVGMFNEQKQAAVKQALEQADKAQGRVDLAGNQMLGHQEKLGDQAFHVSERKAGETFQNANREDQQLFTSKENAKAHAAQRGNTMLQIKGQMDIAREHNRAMLDEARLKAESKGPGEVKEFQAKAAQFAGDLAIASDDIDKFSKGIVGSPLQGAIAGMSFANAIKNKDTQRFATAVARLVNAYGHGTSGTAISETEWDMAKQQFIPLATDAPEELDQKRRYRQDAALSFYQQAGPAQGQVQARLNAYYGGDQSAAKPEAPHQQPDVQQAPMSYVKWH